MMKVSGNYFIFQCFFSSSLCLDILALFTLTNCEKEFECSNALVNENRMVLHHSTKKYSEDVHLCTLDVQNNHEKLLEMSFPLTDGIDIELKCRHNTSLHVQGDKAIAIFTYMSFELTRIISSLILPFGLHFLICVTEKTMHPPYFLDHPNAVYSYEASFGQEMHRDGFMKIKNNLNISYMAILNLRERQIQQQTEDIMQHSAWDLYTEECPTDCIKGLDININNQSEVHNARTLIYNDSISFIILSGEILTILRFTNLVNSNGYHESSDHFYLSFSIKTTHSFFTTSNMTSYENYDVIMNFPGAFAISSYLYYLSDFSKLLLETDRIWEGVLQNKQVQDFISKSVSCGLVKMWYNSFKCGDSFTYEIWKKIPLVLKRKMIEQLKGNSLILRSMITFFKQRYYIDNIDHQRLMEQILFNPTKALQSKPFCDLKKPLCGPGEELIHSLYKEVGWKKSFGWNCRKCSNNFYKTSFGNIEKCQNCPYRMISNKNRSFCFDPYQLEMLSFTDTTSFITVTISFLLVIFMTFTMIVFFVKRDTPIVLSANHKMSAVQLTTHLLLNVAPLLLILDRLSQMKCALIQIVIGLGFSITVSVNISKTQKIFMIVSKQIIMSKFEILLTNASELMIIGSVVLVNISLHLYVLFYSPIRLLVEYHENPPVKEEYCSNENSIFFQMVFAGGLIIANGIQGIRGRNLPSQFRETNHVIYSSFISMMVIFAASAIYFSQQYKVERLVVVCVVTIILNSVHFVLLYTYKVYIILFKSHLNTRNAANRQRIRTLTSSFTSDTAADG